MKKIIFCLLATLFCWEISEIHAQSPTDLVKESKDNYFFIQDIMKDYVFVSGKRIGYGALEPEAWEFQHRGGNKYLIVYRHTMQKLQKAANYGVYLTQMGVLPTEGAPPSESTMLATSSKPVEWTITYHAQSKIYSANCAYGRSRNWRLGFARSVAKVDIEKDAEPLKVKDSYKQVTYSDHVQDVDFARIDNQNPFIKFQTEFTLFRNGEGKRYVKVNLSDTKVSANKGDVNINTNTALVKKWYLDYLDVEVTVKSFNTPFSMVKEGPDPYSGSGSIGFSKSKTLGAELGVAANAEGPSVSASINASMSWGDANSYNLTDFTMKQVSTQATLKHEYQMNLCQKCTGQYRTPTDLVYASSGGLGKQLGDLPAAAKGNFPVLSQGIFATPIGFRGKAVVTIKIRFTLQAIDIRKQPRYEYGYANYEMERSFEVDFSKID